MTKKDNQFGAEVLEKIEIPEEKIETLGELDLLEDELEFANQEGLKEYEAQVGNILDDNKKADLTKLSKIDQGIERGKIFKKEVSELSENLTEQLRSYGEFLGGLSDYTRWENVVGLFRGVTVKDQMRLERVKNASARESLETIIDYSHHIVSKLHSALAENQQCYGSISDAIDSTGQKLEVNEPIYEEWRSKKEQLERDIKELEDKRDLAGSSERPGLELEISAAEVKRHEAEIKENKYFTIVDKATQALPIQRIHLKAYKDIIDSLTVLRVGLEEKIDNVTAIYRATPVAVKTQIRVKSASEVDKAINYATDIATGAVVQASGGILDEGASRAEKLQLSDDKLQLYADTRAKMRAEYDDRIGERKNIYASPAEGPEA